MRRPLFQIVLLLLAGCVAAQSLDRPNILWLVSEDNTTLLGCYGDPLARTPTLDKLAREGVLFERCFAQPVCAPSRFTLITGTFAVASGPANHMRAQGIIPPWLTGFPTLLRDAGYYTTNNAKTDYNAPINAKQAWNECGNRAHYGKRPDPQQPFFSVFNHEVTHESCLFPAREAAPDFTPTDPAKVRVPPYQPDTPEIRADWARYYDHLALLDRLIAAKLQALEQSGLKDDTIVFYYADNGGVLPRSKRFLQESGTHVPLIMYFPPRWRHLAPATPGSRVKHPVSFVDFAPTVLSLAGVKIPDFMQGRAFAGPEAKPNEFVFCTRDRMDERYDMMRSVMDSRWLYIRNYRPDLPYMQPLDYMFRARGYQSWARLAGDGKLTPATAQFWGEKPTEELYEMAADPDSVNNLAAAPAQRETLERMRAALKRHTLEIVDNGFLPEGSPLEGYAASRVAGAYPLERVLAMADRASARNPASLPALIAGLADPSEPVRWWAAQGCAMLRDVAAPAAAALHKSLADASGAVQVAAAEALARQGKADHALPVLERWLQDANSPPCALQAANVLDRLGEAARPALPTLKRVLAAPPTGKDTRQMVGYVQRILEHSIAVLEGKTPALVYPAGAPAMTIPATGSRGGAMSDGTEVPSGASREKSTLLLDVAAIDRARIMQAATAALTLPPVSITQYRAKLSDGGPNDFYSNGDYWWPDPATPDGLPYIRRDGQTNPGNFNQHRIALRDLRDAVAALGAAYQLTGEERHAIKSVELLRTFFLDPATRMNPHLRYAQAVPGRSPGRGAGIIDTLHLIEIPVAIAALQQSGKFPAATLADLQQWFGTYLEWMITSNNGQEEAAATNNHAVAFWLQVAVYARFTGNAARLAECRRHFKEVLVPNQMAADGSFPAELKRTKPYAYSIFQLDNMTALCQVLSTPTDNLWTFELPDGRGIRRAAAYLQPFLADKAKWPLPPDVQAWDAWPARQAGLLFAGLALGEQAYLDLWQKLRPDPADPEVRRNIAITQPLLWL
jgi:arylsulfatase A-like enzyme